MSKLTELIIEGHENFVKGFVRGVLIGTKSGSPVLFNKELNISKSTFAEKIKEFFDTPTTHTHVILDETAVSLLDGVLKKESEKLRLKIVSRRNVTSASFKFKYSAYAENYGNMLKEIFENLPEGVVLSDDYKPKEILHPEAKGAESYAPEHDYVIHAKGSASGDLLNILELYTRCGNEPLVELEKIELGWE